jgi:heptosyltransferase-3
LTDRVSSGAIEGGGEVSSSETGSGRKSTRRAESKAANASGVPPGGPHLLSDLDAGARILIIRIRSMGDTVLMTPALRLLHDWRPDLKITVLVERPWNELLENNPSIDSVMVTGAKIETARRLRRERFQLAVNLHGGPTSALFTRATGAPWRAGFEHFRDGLKYGFAYNLRVPKAQQILQRAGKVHTAEHIASCFFWLGVPPGEIPGAQIFAAAEAAEIVAARLASMGIAAGQGYAVIHPTAATPTKQWKASGFAEAGEYLERERSIRAVYACGTGETAVLDEIERCCGHPILRAEGWRLRELIAVIARSRVFVGNDSGPAHVAAAAGIPVLVIFGSSDSLVWRPWKAARSLVVQNDFDCNPCPGDRCYAFAEPRCIQSITTEQVKVGLESLLGAHSSMDG